MLGAGKRNQRVEIFDVVTVNVEGDRTRYKQAVSPASRWANKKLVSSPRELDIARTFAASCQYIATVLFDDTLNHEQIALIGSDYFAIAGVDQDTDRRETYLYLTQLLSTDVPDDLPDEDAGSALPFALPMALGV